MKDEALPLPGLKKIKSQFFCGGCGFAASLTKKLGFYETADP
jgi:hypothetical protein